jgi:hypothetical protein
MKKIISLLIALILLCSNSGNLYAGIGDVINIQLGGSPPYDNGAAMNDNANQYWNAYSATDITSWATLRYSTGLVSTASLEYNMTGTKGLDASGTAFLPAGIDTPLMRGFVSTDAYNTGTLNIQGLAAGTYKVYLYSQADKNVASTLNVSVNGVGYSLATDGTLSTLTSGTGGNWAMQEVVVTSNGQLNMTFAANSTINGIQIASVPEPGSVILLGAGGIFALGLKRVRSKEEAHVNA